MSRITFLGVCAVLGIICASGAPTKVLPLGDSITFGCGDQCRLNCMKTGIPDCAPCAKGWRGPLWAQLAGNSTTSTNWDFVGTQKTGDSKTMDVDHEGHPGWKSEGIRNISDRWAPLKPDVVLMMLGTNNLGLLGMQSAEVALGHMGDLLNTTFTLLPNTRLLLATLIGSSRITYGGLKHAAYNTGIKNFVTKYAALGRNIELVDMDQESHIGKYCEHKDCCPAGIHPNDIGYAAMAKVWYKHLTKTTPANVMV